MESAYVLMLGTFAAAVVLGALFRSRAVATLLALLVPVAGVASKIKGGGANAETLLFISPFLVAGLLIYGFIAFVGARLGCWFRSGQRSKVQPRASQL